MLLTDSLPTTAVDWYLDIIRKNILKLYGSDIINYEYKLYEHLCTAHDSSFL